MSGSSDGRDLIVLRGVEKTYQQGRKSVTAVAGISLTIRQGEFLAILGPSGSGKSTLLHLIGGLDKPTAGEVIVAGQNLGALSNKALSVFRRRRIGVVFQFFNLFPTLTAVENVMIPLLLNGGGVRGARSTAESLLEQVGLAERCDHLPEELSGGEVQRVAVARALALAPPIILADEPTGNLDSDNSAALIRLLQSLVHETHATLVLVTHATEIASQADRTGTMVDGRLTVSDGSEPS